MSYLKDKYTKVIADKISVSVEDLLDSELEIITACYDIFKDRLSDISTMEKEIYRLNIELANLKSMSDNKDYE